MPRRGSVCKIASSYCWIPNLMVIVLIWMAFIVRQPAVYLRVWPGLMLAIVRASQGMERGRVGAEWRWRAGLVIVSAARPWRRSRSATTQAVMACSGSYAPG